MSSSSLGSLLTAIEDLKRIINRDQGEKHETALLLRQLEQLVTDINEKAGLILPVEAAVAAITPAQNEGTPIIPVMHQVPTPVTIAAPARTNVIPSVAVSILVQPSTPLQASM